MSAVALYRAILRKLDCELPGVQSVRKDTDTEVTWHTKQFIEPLRGKYEYMNLSKTKKLQIANVLETGKEIPSSVSSRATPGHTRIDMGEAAAVEWQAASGSCQCQCSYTATLRGEVVKTLTLDRGSEFARAAELQ